MRAGLIRHVAIPTTSWTRCRRWGSTRFSQLCAKTSGTLPNAAGRKPAAWDNTDAQKLSLARDRHQSTPLTTNGGGSARCAPGYFAPAPVLAVKLTNWDSYPKRQSETPMRSQKHGPTTRLPAIHAVLRACPHQSRVHETSTFYSHRTLWRAFGMNGDAQCANECANWKN